MVKDVPANGMKEFQAEGGLKMLVANSGAEYFAVQAICPHQEVNLCDGFYDGSVLTCAQHLWQWDIRTGAPMGLAEAPLERYDVMIEDGALFVGSQGALDVGELFSGVAATTLAALTALARREEFEAGSWVYRHGDAAEELVVLESGRVEFQIGRDDRTTPAGFILKKGEVFGWNALLEHYPQRIAGAKCHEKTSVLKINGKAMLKVLETDPAAGFIVMRRLSSLINRYLAAPGNT
jgi:toluene monooxygenase system ferredoxin subunit